MLRDPFVEKCVPNYFRRLLHHRRELMVLNWLRMEIQRVKIDVIYLPRDADLHRRLMGFETLLSELNRYQFGYQRVQLFVRPPVAVGVAIFPE